MTLTGANCTCVNSSGTAISSAKNGDVIYVTVGDNNHTTQERTVKINATITGCSTYVTSTSWTQDADSEYSCYDYSTTVSSSSTTTACAANSAVTITPRCSATKKYY